ELFDPSDDSLMWAYSTSGWGLMKTDGVWVIPPKYEEVGSLAEGRAAVRFLGKWGYIDRTGTEVIAPAFDQAIHFHNGMAAVLMACRWGYIDQTGKTVVQPQFSGAEIFADNGLALVRAGELSGLIDRFGAWVIEPHYQKIWRGQTDADIVWAEVGGKFGALDRSGRIIATPQFSQVGVVCDDGWVMGYSDGRPRIIRDLDKPIAMASGELSGLGCYSPFRIKNEGKFGFVDRQLRRITDVKFDDAYIFFERAAVVKLDGKFGYIRDDGTWLIEPRFEKAESFSSGAAVVSLGGEISYVKADGNLLIEPKFEEAEAVVPGFAIVNMNGKRGIIDATGAWVRDTASRHLSRAPRGSGLVAIRSGTKWGFVDAGGVMVIEPKYDEVRPFERGISWVKVEGSWCA